MPTQESPATEAANDYRQRYEELAGSSLSQCPVCHQRSHACDCDLAPQSTQENRGYGYLMMNRTIFGCKLNRAAQARPGQATGGVLPPSSFRRFSKGQMSSPNALIAHWRYTALLPAILNADRFRPFSARQRSSRQPIHIGHALGGGFVLSIFSPASRRTPFPCFPTVSRRDADLKHCIEGMSDPFVGSR
jgi:hypothetical protein